MSKYVVIAIASLLLVLTIVIFFFAKSKSTLDDSSSVDPNFVLEQAYFEQLGSIGKKFYKALPAPAKLMAINSFRVKNPKVVKRIFDKVSENIARQASLIASNTSKSMIASSTMSSIAKALDDMSNLTIEESTFKDHMRTIANAITESSVSSVSESVSKSLSKEDATKLVTDRMTQASNDAISTILAKMDDGDVKNQTRDLLTSTAYTVITRAVDTLMSGFSSEVAKDKNAVFATASAMATPLTKPLWDGSKILQITPVVGIVNGNVVVDIGKTIDIAMSQIEEIVNDRVSKKQLTKKDATNVRETEKKQLRELLESRLKTPSSLAFVSAQIAVKSV